MSLEFALLKVFVSVSEVTSLFDTPGLSFPSTKGEGRGFGILSVNLQLLHGLLRSKFSLKGFEVICRWCITNDVTIMYDYCYF
jgi:hypothetical protein